MRNPALTERLERRIRRDFGPAAADRVVERLASWRIPYEEGNPGERLLAAAVFYANGLESQLEAALRLAETDWRDLLVAGGLGSEGWRERLDELLGEWRTPATSLSSPGGSCAPVRSVRRGHGLRGIGARQFRVGCERSAHRVDRPRRR